MLLPRFFFFFYGTTFYWNLFSSLNSWDKIYKPKIVWTVRLPLKWILPKAVIIPNKTLIFLKFLRKYCTLRESFLKMPSIISFPLQIFTESTLFAEPWNKHWVPGWEVKPSLCPHAIQSLGRDQTLNKQKQWQMLKYEVPDNWQRVGIAIETIHVGNKAWVGLIDMVTCKLRPDVLEEISHTKNIPGRAKGMHVVPR